VEGVGGPSPPTKRGKEKRGLESRLRKFKLKTARNKRKKSLTGGEKIGLGGNGKNFRRDEKKPYATRSSQVRRSNQKKGGEN